MTNLDQESLLKPLRDKIDHLDQQLLALIAERAKTAGEVGQIKDQYEFEVYDPDREATVLQKLSELNEGPLSDQAIRHIFRQIIAACRNLEEKPTVAFLGPKGTFSHQAVFAHFGAQVDAVAADGFSEVAESVARGEVDYGILPIENAIEGCVETTLDMVAENNLAIIGEIIVPVKLHMVANCPLEEIKVVYSHHQPLKQARKWLRSHVPNAATIPVESTAKAAQRAENEVCAAAIVGPMLLADIRPLDVLAGPIEDYPNNCTRFWALGRRQSRAGDKSALMLVLQHQPGALARALSVFADNKVNLTQIVSRPVPTQPWEYRFFVEMAANPYQEPAKTILKQLNEHGAQYHVLGTFPAADQDALESV